MNKKSIPVERKPFSNLVIYCFSIISSGLLLQYYYCWWMDRVFQIPISPIVYTQQAFNFSDLWSWFTFPDTEQTVYSLPPTTILILRGIWGNVNILTNKIVTIHLHFLAWLSVLTYAFYYIINDHAALNIKKILLSFLIILFAYPTVFNMERQNPAGFVTAACMLGVIFYQEKRFAWSIACLAVASNMKIIPLVFLVLPFIDRRWLLLAKYGLATSVLFVISIMLIRWLYDPAYTLEKFATGLQGYYSLFVLSDHGGPWETSMFKLVKEGLHCFWSKDYPQSIPAALRIYHIGVFIFTVIMLILLYIRRPPLLYLTTILSCWFILAPDDMTNYYLMILFLPLAFAIREENELYAILLSFALIPKWIYIPGMFPTTTHPFASAGLIFGILIFCMIEVYRMPNRAINESTSSSGKAGIAQQNATSLLQQFNAP